MMPLAIAMVMNIGVASFGKLNSCRSAELVETKFFTEKKHVHAVFFSTSFLFFV
jgi:hypothetical protein